MASGTGTTGPPARYGWLGADQRSSDALGGAILMGQRLYLPTIGRFLSVDSVPGGSANPYDYCNADPVNCTDLNGTWPHFTLRQIVSAVAVVASVASTIPGPVGMAAAGISAVAYLAVGDKQQAMIAAAGIALAAVGAGVATVAVAAKKVAQVAVDARDAVRVARAARAAVGNAPGIGKELVISERSSQWAERLLLGRGARPTSVGRMSSDGLRQTRSPTLKSVGYVQMNFQSRVIPKKAWINNYHVKVI